jgi:hypothetical protein
MISANTLKDYTNQSRPIRIHLADGREIRVPHGEHLSLQPAGRMFSVWSARGGFEVFNLTMVTSIAVVEDEKAKTKQRKKG